MNIKKHLSRMAVLALVVSCLGLSSKPASAYSFGARNFQIPCDQATNTVNFLLAVDREVEEELAEGSITQAQATAFDAYIDNAIAFIAAHVAGSCTLPSE